MRDIGKNIRWAREQRGYTQEELAQLLFVTRQTVSNYETGRSRPDVETLTRLSELLDVEVTDLIYGPEPVQSRTSLGVRLGSVFILWADAFARCAFGAVELPIGIVTAFIGAPFFMFLMIRNGYGGGKQ